jgi:hypothetical protein
MKRKLAIKIVKREELERREESAAAAGARGRAAGASARDTGHTVAAWVSEFRRRQRPQSKIAITVRLFRDAVSGPAEA